MKTKRENMTARFTKECANARNMNGEKEVINRVQIIDKKTEKPVVDCRLYMGSSRGASTVYCSVWVSISEKKTPAGWSYGWTTGRGDAGGYGYHKQSAAVESALSSAGIELYGSPYNRVETMNVDGKTVKQKTRAKRAHIGGCGDQAMKDALLAVAYAAGYTDCIFVD